MTIDDLLEEANGDDEEFSDTLDAEEDELEDIDDEEDDD